MPATAPRCLAGALLLLAATGAFAADDAIVTDRPDFVESSDVVGRNRFQIETGVAVERDRSSGVRERTFTTPTLIRFGVHDDFELRGESDGRIVSRVRSGGDSRTDRGWSDLSVGVKWHQQDGEGPAPSVGWLLHADIDSGSAAFRGNGVRPSLRVAAEWELPGDFSLGVMPGIALDRTDSGKRHAVGIFGVVVGMSWTEHWRGFVEVAVPRIARHRYGGSLASFDLGTAWLVTPNVQLDAIVQIGANRRTADLGAGLGVSARF